MTGDPGFRTNPGTRLRDLIRDQARKTAEEFDQVVLAEVSDPGDGVTVGLLLDGFAGGEVQATWCVPAPAVISDRVAVVMLRGGQKFFVTGVLGVSPPTGVTDHGLLDGPSLLDDDHTQYLLIDGTRAMTGALQLDVGTELLPGLHWAGDPDTGWRWVSADKIAASVGGGDVLSIYDAGVEIELAAGAFTIAQQSAPTDYLFNVSDTAWVVGFKGWAGWAITEAQQDGAGATEGARWGLRGADGTILYDDWHFLVSGYKYKLLSQENDAGDGLVVWLEIDYNAATWAMIGNVKVGINDPAPSHELDLASADATDTVARLTADTTGMDARLILRGHTTSEIWFGDSTDERQAFLRYDPATEEWTVWIDDSAAAAKRAIRVIGGSSVSKGDILLYDTVADQIVMHYDESTGGIWKLYNRGGTKVFDTGAWASYTPTWTTTGTAPSLGNGTLNGYWTRIGRFVHCTIELIAGSTTTFGTGVFKFGLPVTGVQRSNTGAAWGLDSGNVYRTGVALIGGVQDVSIYGDGGGAPWGSLIPHTWASGDKIRISFSYEKA